MNPGLLSCLLAYIDPGSGAIILQVIIAFILAVGVYFRRYFVSPIALLWARIRGVSDQPEEDEAKTS